MMIPYLFIILLFATQGNTLSEGDACSKHDGNPGNCKPITSCPSALLEIKERKSPKICSFESGTLVVCCASETKQPPRKHRLRNMRTTTTTGAPIDLKYSTECSTAERTGKKAHDKCLEYQEKYVYPCRDSGTPSGGLVRINQCNRKPEDLITGGMNSYFGEFPHMALLGYGAVQTKWMCGGVIVSERYILTAGHCIYSRTSGPVLKARVGILERTETVEPEKEYNVEVIKHPDYKPPLKYNDIALLKTDRDIALDRYTLPACLHDGGPLKNDSAIVSGWGTTVFRAQALADVLQKATVTRFDEAECHDKLDSIRHLTRGYDHSTQMCYGDRESNKDSCEGDSGGPLQVNHPTIQCMYSVIGIISSGKWCGFAGEPGIYTRVSAYLPWIESVVWP
ncbi:serine protease snake-like [Colias croceus]|uniref:serine protease snake-like n=1 Tax=Colias crocea TaxID=72248 RepID=UPI001E27FCE4|nr:serine protease snake-like [Colias croceus]XP_045506160.1 serine protease snake-like [Colias croceus]XP_045506161.1 serine protease snake-like [Colias croceus]